MTRIDLRGTKLDLDCMLRDHPKQTFVYRPPEGPPADSAPAPDPQDTVPALDLADLLSDSPGPSETPPGRPGRIKLTDVGPDWKDPDLHHRDQKETILSGQTTNFCPDTCTHIVRTRVHTLSGQKNEECPDKTPISVRTNGNREIGSKTDFCPDTCPDKLWNPDFKIPFSRYEIASVITQDVSDGERIDLRVGHGAKSLLRKVSKGLGTSPADFIRQAIVEMLCRYLE